jgi:hypothetical protein
MLGSSINFMGLYGSGLELNWQMDRLASATRRFFVSSDIFTYLAQFMIATRLRPINIGGASELIKNDLEHGDVQSRTL